MENSSNETTKVRPVCFVCHGGVRYGDLVKVCRCNGSRALAHPPCITQLMFKGIRSCYLCNEPYDRVFRPHWSRQMVEQLVYLNQQFWYIVKSLLCRLACILLLLAFIFHFILLPFLLVAWFTVVCVAEYFVTYKVFSIMNLLLALLYCSYGALCSLYYHGLQQTGIL